MRTPNKQIPVNAKKLVVMDGDDEEWYLAHRRRCLCSPLNFRISERALRLIFKTLPIIVITVVISVTFDLKIILLFMLYSLQSKQFLIYHGGL